MPPPSLQANERRHTAGSGTLRDRGPNSPAIVNEVPLIEGASREMLPARRVSSGMRGVRKVHVAWR